MEVKKDKGIRYLYLIFYYLLGSLLIPILFTLPFNPRSYIEIDRSLGIYMFLCLPVHFFARELFRNPQILIFDEATSALDSQSELAIQKSIESIKGDRTVIIISHRLSTITNVDKIYVLDNGSIIEEGNYKELSSDEDSKFSQFVNLQKI